MKKQEIKERLYKKLLKVANKLSFIIWRIKTRKIGLDRW